MLTAWIPTARSVRPKFFTRCPGISGSPGARINPVHARQQILGSVSSPRFSPFRNYITPTCETDFGRCRMGTESGFGGGYSGGESGVIWGCLAGEVPVKHTDHAPELPATCGHVRDDLVNYFRGSDFGCRVTLGTRRETEIVSSETAASASETPSAKALSRREGVAASRNCAGRIASPRGP